MALFVTVDQNNLTVKMPDSYKIQRNKRFMDKTDHTVHLYILCF
ncbi:Uncharacterised protein [Ewingella americana]|uniref:Uncharacterized protein n=1 Tax=Ewingella americana TaxID=41202 RepID=A0A377N930_9GAMM|nr:Uncharacterised protein [Ewingella americana]